MRKSSNDKSVVGRKAVSRKQSSLKHTIEAAKAAVSLSTTEPNSLMRPVQYNGANTLQTIMQYRDEYKGGSLNAPSIRGAVAFSDTLGQYKSGSNAIRDKDPSNMLKYTNKQMPSMPLICPVFHEDSMDDVQQRQTVNRLRKKQSSQPPLLKYDNVDWFPGPDVYGTKGEARDLPKGSLLGSVFDMSNSGIDDSKLYNAQVGVTLSDFPTPLSTRNAHQFFCVAYMVAPDGEQQQLGRSENCQSPSLHFTPGVLVPFHPNWHLTLQFDVYMVGNDQQAVLTARSRLSVCQLLENKGQVRHPAVFSDTMVNTLKLSGALVCPMKSVHDKNLLGNVGEEHQGKILNLQRCKSQFEAEHEAVSSDLPILVSKMLTDEKIIRNYSKGDKAFKNIEGASFDDCMRLWSNTTQKQAPPENNGQGRLIQEPCSFCFTLVGSVFPSLTKPPKCSVTSNTPTVQEQVARPPGSTIGPVEVVLEKKRSVILPPMETTGDDEGFDLALLKTPMGSFLSQVYDLKLKDGVAMTPGSVGHSAVKGTLAVQLQERSFKFINSVIYNMHKGILNFALRGLGPGATSLIADWLQVEGVEKCWSQPRESQENTCKTLDLSYNLVGDHGLRCLAESIRIHPSIEELSVVATGTTAHTVREGSTALCCLLDSLGGSVSALEEKLEGKAAATMYVEPQQLEIRQGAIARVNYLLAPYGKEVSLAQWTALTNRSVTLLDISGSVPVHVPVLVKVKCNNRKDMKNGVGVSLLGHAGSKSLSRLLVNTSTLTHLGLRNTGLGLFQGSTDQLSIGLRVNQSLRHLDIAGNALLPSHIAHICAGLTGRTRAYQDLIRGVDQVSKDEIAELDLTNLESNHTQLDPQVYTPCIHKISFASNSLTDLGVEYVCNWAATAPFLEFLDLTDVGLSANGIQYLLSMLNNPQCVLRELVQNHNQLHATATSGMKVVSNDISTKTSPDNSQDALQMLSDEEKQLRSKKQAKQQPSLHPEVVYDQIQTLFKKNATAHAASSLKSIPAPLLKAKLTMNTHLEVISLAHSGIDDLLVEPLMHALGQCTSLQHLDLSSNRIRCVGAASIAKHTLSKSSKLHLRTLKLQSNSIGDAGGIAIAKELHHNQSLTGLYLHNNHLGTKSAGYLLTALSLNETLIHCNVLSNRMPFEKFKRLDKLARMNQQSRYKNIIAGKLNIQRILSAQTAQIPVNISEARYLHDKKESLQAKQLEEEQGYEADKQNIPSEKLPLQQQVVEARQAKEAIAKDYITTFPEDSVFIQELISNTQVQYQKGNANQPNIRRGSNSHTNSNNALQGNVDQRRTFENRRGSSGSNSGAVGVTVGGSNVVQTRHILEELVSELEQVTKLKQQQEYLSSYLQDFTNQLEQDLAEEEARVPDINDLNNLLDDDDDEIDLLSSDSDE